MDLAKIGYYSQRAKARVPIDKGMIAAAFGERKDHLRVECLEGCIILTDPDDKAWRHRND